MGYFSNATITITRSQGNRTAAGFEQTGTKEILQSRGDAQESGRSLARAQQLFETGDVLFFAEKSVADVDPGDSVEIQHDDRTLTGSVDEVIPLDNKLLISL